MIMEYKPLDYENYSQCDNGNMRNKIIIAKPYCEIRSHIVRYKVTTESHNYGK